MVKHKGFLLMDSLPVDFLYDTKTDLGTDRIGISTDLLFIRLVIISAKKTKTKRSSSLSSEVA